MNVLAKKPAPQIEKVKDHVGAIITGVDLTKPMDAETFKTVYDALLENVAIVIRGNVLTPAQYQAAAEQFGELMEDQNRMYLVDGHPLISVLSNRHKASDGKPAKIANNATWHTDHTNQECPPKFTMLYAVELPDTGGGTAVCNMRDAYEALPEDIREKIVDMKTENTLISSARDGQRQPGYRQGAESLDQAAHSAAAGAHPPGNRYQINLVPQIQDRAGHRHGAAGNAGLPGRPAGKIHQARIPLRT